MLEAAKIIVRRIAASLVFLATLAFVLQGAAFADGHRHLDTLEQVSAGAHSHGPEESHSHSFDSESNSDTVSGDPGSPGHDHGSEQTDSCCGKFCSAATCTSAPELFAAEFRLPVSAAVPSQVPDGIGPKGLKRPPRTIGIT